MRINRSDSASHLFTEAEAQQLRQENGSVGPRPSSEPRLWPESEKQERKLETSPPGASTPTVPMLNEELADLLVEALQGHRLVLEVLASMQERLTGEATAVRTALERVTNLVINMEYMAYEEYNDALQEEV